MFDVVDVWEPELEQLKELGLGRGQRRAREDLDQVPKVVPTARGNNREAEVCQIMRGRGGAGEGS